MSVWVYTFILHPSFFATDSLCGSSEVATDCNSSNESLSEARHEATGEVLGHIRRFGDDE